MELPQSSACSLEIPEFVAPLQISTFLAAILRIRRRQAVLGRRKTVIAEAAVVKLL